MAPVGAKLSMQQLVDAILYKTTRRAGKAYKYSVPELDVMEQKLQVAVSLLRGARNAIQPINKLPPELLSLIFGELQQELPSFLPMLEGGPGPVPVYAYDNQHKDWLRLLHVCRQWRGILATSPHLWSTIDSGLIPATFLKRSMAAPLTVYLGVRAQEISHKLLTNVLHNSSRLEEFHLSTDGWDGAPIYQSLSSFSSAAPLLTSLTILTDGEQAIDGVLPVVFAGETPNLRQLCLKHFTSWPSNSFECLTHLCLYNQHESSRPTTSAFLDFLASSPRLQNLSLVQAGPTRSDDAPIPRDKHVSLPFLKEFNIGDWPSAQLISRLLTHLMLPSTTDMYIWGDPLNNTDDDLSLLLPADISCLRNIHDIKRWYFARQPRVILDTPFIAVTGSPRTLYMYGTFSYSQIHPVISSYPLGQVHTLGVRDSCGMGNRMPQTMWTEIFEKVPLLESLQILAFRSFSITRTVLTALMPYGSPSSPSVLSPCNGNSSELGSDHDSSSSGRGGSRPTNTDRVHDTSDLDVKPSSSAAALRVLCPLLHTLTIEHDCSLPAYFISTVASSRAALGSPISHLKVLVFDRHPYDSRASSEAGGDRDDSEADEEYLVYMMDTEDHKRLLTRGVGQKAEDDSETGPLREVIFEYNIPLSMNIVPETWPTRVWEWTRRMHV
ncbi:hypothetical protein D9758_008568 [Tetrapyrgos nigripes]|uniref:F-box domain-containing protein n=1 Tax=Tetrapyrgos nigripes TaxID=182062 RepID=A0A8H5G5T2_9AGAR|nr:hypothetical protein D9758_008568 [Tetrapyrgos nigripes]